jgi:hypothetical protein
MAHFLKNGGLASSIPPVFLTLENSGARKRATVRGTPGLSGECAQKAAFPCS